MNFLKFFFTIHISWNTHTIIMDKEYNIYSSEPIVRDTVDGQQSCFKYYRIECMATIYNFTVQKNRLGSR